MNRRGVLEAVAYCEDVYGSMITCSQVTRRDVMRCVRAGLVRSVGLVTVTDESGFSKDPARFREGFRLTEAGTRALNDHSLRIY